MASTLQWRPIVEREFANDPEDQARLQLLLARLYGEAGVQTRAEVLLQRAARSARYVDDANLKVQIEKGEPFDVAILTAAEVDDLIKQGKLAAATRAGIASPRAP